MAVNYSYYIDSPKFSFFKIFLSEGIYHLLYINETSKLLNTIDAQSIQSVVKTWKTLSM